MSWTPGLVLISGICSVGFFGGLQGRVHRRYGMFPSPWYHGWTETKINTAFCQELSKWAPLMRKIWPAHGRQNTYISTGNITFTVVYILSSEITTRGAFACLRSQACVLKGFLVCVYCMPMNGMDWFVSHIQNRVMWFLRAMKVRIVTKSHCSIPAMVERLWSIYRR